MVSVEEALKILESEIPVLPTRKVRIIESLGGILAEDVLSPIDMPPFDQSAMDGYAIHYSEEITEYRLVGEVAAGSAKNPELKPGEAVRIFTGAMVPDTANRVIQQELVVAKENTILLEKVLKDRANIRSKGEQIVTGNLAVESGNEINPAMVGFLAGLGLTEVSITGKPLVVIITTGNELVDPGKRLLPGQIYESNSGMLCTALKQYGFDNFEVVGVSDDYLSTYNQIKAVAEQADMVILTGGISVGDYDFVGRALNELGTNKLFYKVKQKPGKPLYMGKLNDTVIAALPGNPAAALTCFYSYVLPSLNKMCGLDFKGLDTAEMAVENDYKLKGDRAVFLKAFYKNNSVKILDMQSSAMLRSYAAANALVYIPQGVDSVKAGDKVNVLKI